MLQLSVRIVQPRPNWWAAAAQHVLVSSVATGTNLQLDSANKISDDEKVRLLLYAYFLKVSKSTMSFIFMNYIKHFQILECQ